MLGWILLAIGLCAASGLASLALPRGTRRGDGVFAVLMGAGGLLGCASALAALVRGVDVELSIAWPAPWGRLAFHLDALAAGFLLPAFIVPALGAVYAFEYWSEEHHPRSARRLRVFYGLLAAAMALLVLARDGLSFLLAWEAMALSAFFAISADDEDARVRRAAWIYLVAAHACALALLSLFALLRSLSGSFELAPLPSDLSSESAAAIFVLALVGFGLKAGLMPLHVWLPGAHANAPSHVSAVLSGAMLKIGLYGLVRVTSLLPAVPFWWGWLLTGIGAGSAVVGIAFAIGQTDCKRLLAYSSIENVGVIALALGLALLGRASGDPVLTALALAGALLHAWNHALFKPLLFFAAGSVLHVTGTRDLARLGGLGKKMPRTAALAALGCVAIAALPPLNGFVSEWFVYRACLHGLANHGGILALGSASAAAALATTGALALAAFVKLFGTAFLGKPRSNVGERARDPSGLMLAPMAVLALACLVIGLAPAAVAKLLAPMIERAGAPQGSEGVMLDAGAPLRVIGAISAALLAAVFALFLWLKRRARASPLPRPGTWDCGYVRPSARMQYGPSSLGQMLVDLFSGILRPRASGVEVKGTFPAPAAHEVEIQDVVLDRLLLPSLSFFERIALRLRSLQQARVQVYVLYILLALLLLLLTIP